MRHENSYKENMKKSATEKRKKEERFLLELLSQLVIDEALVKARQAKLVAEIDRALDNHDKDAFYDLTNKYNQFLKQNILS